MTRQEDSVAMDLIDLHAVSMTYPGPSGDGHVDVFSGVSLTLAPGEFVCVSGRSGSGKTTMLYLASGLLRPTGGWVTWSGRPLDGLSPDALARLRSETMGFVFQYGGLVSTLTASENVAVAGLPHGLDRGARRRCLELLDVVGCAARADHYPAQLSGGEVQRVALARALFADPPAVLVDEPTANLDRATADAIVSLLLDLRVRGKALLVASHDPRVIGAADRRVPLD